MVYESNEANEKKIIGVNKILTVKAIEATIIEFAGVERKFFEKGIRRDRKPVPIHLLDG